MNNKPHAQAHTGMFQVVVVLILLAITPVVVSDYLSSKREEEQISQARYQNYLAEVGAQTYGQAAQYR